jgi:hypothetical protein
MTQTRITAADRFQLAFIKHCLGVRESTPTLNIWSEIGYVSVSDAWIKKIMGFYNMVWARPDSDLVKIAMRECMSNIEKSGTWSEQLNGLISRLTGNGLRSYINGQGFIDIDAVLEDKRKKEFKGMFRYTKGLLESNIEVQNLPISSSKGFKGYVYFKWFSQDGQGEHGHFRYSDREARKKRFWFCLNRRDQIQAVAQFRLGAHWLAIENGRFVVPKISRDKRYCPFCGRVELQLNVQEHDQSVKASITCYDMVVGDEWHFFRCAKFEGMRKEFPLFQDACALERGQDDGFRTIMNPQGDVDTKVFWEKYATSLIRCRGTKWGFKAVK